MADIVTLLLLVGAATPPGRLPAAIDHAAEAARSEGTGIVVDILNLADTAIDICDGRALDAYGETTRQAVARISWPGAVLIGVPVFRASFPGVLKTLPDSTPVDPLQNKPVGLLAMGGSAHHYLAIDTQ